MKVWNLYYSMNFWFFASDEYVQSIMQTSWKFLFLSLEKSWHLKWQTEYEPFWFTLQCWPVTLDMRLVSVYSKVSLHLRYTMCSPVCIYTINAICLCQLMTAQWWSVQLWHVSQRPWIRVLMFQEKESVTEMWQAATAEIEILETQLQVKHAHDVQWQLQYSQGLYSHVLYSWRINSQNIVVVVPNKQSINQTSTHYSLLILHNYTDIVIVY